VTPAEIAAWVERSRARQGLGPKITDPAVIARLITLAFAGEGKGGGGRARAS
jgi:hypothetical protein